MFGTFKPVAYFTIHILDIIWGSKSNAEHSWVSREEPYGQTWEPHGKVHVSQKDRNETLMGAAARGCLHLVGRSKPLLPQISHIAPPLSVLGSAPPLPPRQAPAWPALPLPAATPGLSRVTETKPPHTQGRPKKEARPHPAKRSDSSRKTWRQANRKRGGAVPRTFGAPCRPVISSFVLWQASLTPQLWALSGQLLTRSLLRSLTDGSHDSYIRVFGGVATWVFRKWRERGGICVGLRWRGSGSGSGRDADGGREGFRVLFTTTFL